MCKHEGVAQDVGLGHGKVRLVCLQMPACVACTFVHAVANLLARRSFSVEFIDCVEDETALERYGGEGTPYWCLLEGDEVIESLYPADDTSVLFDFVTRLDEGVSREDFEAALAEGRSRADLLEAARAELAVRSADTDATELVSAARIKIANPCLAVTDEGELRTCLERNAAKLEERLRERIAAPGGDTSARREVIEQMPALVDELAKEIADILMAAQEDKVEG